MSLTDVRGAERITVLRQHVSRRGLAPLILGQPGFFALLAKLADAAPVQVLRRPPGDWTLDAVLDAIESGRAVGRSDRWLTSALVRPWRPEINLVGGQTSRDLEHRGRREPAGGAAARQRAVPAEQPRVSVPRPGRRRLARADTDHHDAR